MIRFNNQMQLTEYHTVNRISNTDDKTPISTQITWKLHQMNRIQYDNTILKIHSNHSPILEGKASLEDPHTVFDVGFCNHLNALELAPTNLFYKGIHFFL